MDKKKVHMIIFAINITYLLIFMIIFPLKNDFEFLLYNVFVAIMTFLIYFLHRRLNFSTGLLCGLTLLGILHELGGNVFICGDKLYAFYVIPDILKYDKLIHGYGIFIFTLLIFRLLKPYLKEINNRYVFFIILVFVGLGVGTIWEFVEFVTVLVLPKTGVGGYFNTLKDLVANAVGAIVAIFYLNIKLRIGQRRLMQK